MHAIMIFKMPFFDLINFFDTNCFNCFIDEHDLTFIAYYKLDM